MPTLTEFQVTNDALSYVMAGNATFTLKSMKTGTRFTYKVVHKEANERYSESWMVLYLYGPQNTSDFAYMGQIRKGKFSLTPKSIESGLNPATPCVNAFSWVLGKLQANVEPPNTEIWRASSCCRCGRPLTVPESIEAGIGPECASKM